MILTTISIWLSGLYMHGVIRIVPPQGMRNIIFSGCWNLMGFVRCLGWLLYMHDVRRILCEISDILYVEIFKDLWAALLHLQLTVAVLMGSRGLGVRDTGHNPCTLPWVSWTVNTPETQGGVQWHRKWALNKPASTGKSCTKVLVVRNYRKLHRVWDVSCISFGPLCITLPSYVLSCEWEKFG